MGNFFQNVKKLCQKLFCTCDSKDSEEDEVIHPNSLNDPFFTNKNSTDENNFNYKIQQTGRTFYSSYTQSSKISKNINSLPGDKNVTNKITLQDFQVIKTLGKGSFGKVLLVKSTIEEGKYYAMKVLKKSMLKQKKQIDHTKTEREILEKIKHPFIVRLYFAFQTNEKLFLLTEFISGGEIFFHLRKAGCFSEERTRFYISEIVLALEYLHKKNIIYRDLKPENVLLNKDGHIKLTDFGLSKILSQTIKPPETQTESVQNNNLNTSNITNQSKHNRAFTICGTPEYLAPEILLGKGYNKSVDWWSMGALMYEMLVGYSPYKENKHRLEVKTYFKTIEPHRNLSNNAYDLIKKLLNTDYHQRLGASDTDAEEIKAHPFFNGLNWKNVYDCKIKSPFVPLVRHTEDLSNFDSHFTKEDPYSCEGEKFNLFPSSHNTTHDSQKTYKDFTFIHKDFII
jgi:protein-serine/threonine kinase